MAQPIQINTSRFTTGGKIEVDGMVWDVKLQGAGSELRYSQAQRQVKLYSARLEMLDKKIADGTITESELDKYEEYSAIYQENEAILFSELGSMFSDSTKDNKQVKEWLDKTPVFAVIAAFEEVNNGIEAVNEPKADTGTETKSS